MTETIFPVAALLSTATLFGGMVLYSGGLAPLLFTQLPVADASRLLRTAFPWFYLFIIIMAAVATLLFLSIDTLSSWLLGIVCVLGVAARQLLMPAINRASDASAAGDPTGKPRFKRLHNLSVAINFLQLALIAFALYRFV